MAPAANTGAGRARLAFGHAGPNVARIRVYNSEREWIAPAGVDGFFLLGALRDEPETRAVALDRNGNPVSAPPLVL